MLELLTLSFSNLHCKLQYITYRLIVLFSLTAINLICVTMFKVWQNDITNAFRLFRLCFMIIPCCLLRVECFSFIKLNWNGLLSFHLLLKQKIGLLQLAMLKRWEEDCRWTWCKWADSVRLVLDCTSYFALNIQSVTIVPAILETHVA